MRKFNRRPSRMVALGVLLAVTMGVAGEVWAGLIALPKMKEPPPATGEPDEPHAPQALTVPMRDVQLAFIEAPTITPFGIVSMHRIVTLSLLRLKAIVRKS